MGSTSVSRTLVVGVVLVACGLLVSFTGSTTGTVISRPSTTDPRTQVALLRIATQFNRDYAANNDGPVYDRWDRESKLIIARDQYLRRHTECPTNPGAATIESANRGTDGYWLVHYSISGIQFIDYWHYQDGQWRFSLLRSNPSAVKLYELTFRAYAAAVGCATFH